MTKANLRFTYVLTFIILLVEGLMVVNGSLSFGLGLGDLAMLFMMIIMLVVFGLLVFIKSKSKESDVKSVRVVIFVGMLLTLLYFVLHVSILRGSENPWNGNLFVN